MTLTRATLGTLTKRATKDIEIDGNAVRIQRPTPLEWSQYQLAIIDKDGTGNAAKIPDAVMLLTARMWIDDEGERLFKDTETKQLGSIELGFYKQISEECWNYARVNEAPEVLGESVATIASDSPAVSASNSE